MATLFCWFTIVLLLACAVLEFTRWRVIATRLLILFPAALCCSLLVDLVKGPVKLGQAAFNSDLRTLPFLSRLSCSRCTRRHAPILAMALLANLVHQRSLLRHRRLPHILLEGFQLRASHTTTV